jgi:hypothetical protein
VVVALVTAEELAALGPSFDLAYCISKTPRMDRLLSPLLTKRTGHFGTSATGASMTKVGHREALSLIDFQPVKWRAARHGASWPSARY